MIDKFIKIKSIGKFKNYSYTGDLQLNQFNLIYGENSSGKTTLVSVLDH